jgi:four helix bundle protein
MKFERFEDIIAWQKSKCLSVAVYKCFKDLRDYSFKDQICRASVSIMNNIAEGFERGSNNEFKHFLFIAKGSSAEVRSMLYLAKDISYISDENFEKLFNQTDEICKILSGLIKTL